MRADCKAVNPSIANVLDIANHNVVDLSIINKRIVAVVPFIYGEHKCDSLIPKSKISNHKK